MQKPHRLIETVTGYADDAAAYLRRRRLTRDPYARVWWSGDRGAAFDASTEEGRTLFLAASRLIDVGSEGE